MNDLDADARHALVLSVVQLCRKMGAEAARRCGRPRESADFVADAYLACVEAAAKWRPGAAKFSTYATHWVRTAMRRAACTLDPATLMLNWEAVTGRPDDDGGVPHALDPSPLAAEFARPLARLNEPTRTVVTLWLTEDVTPDQIAERIGRSVKDVKLMMRNAARDLTPVMLPRLPQVPPPTPAAASPETPPTNAATGLTAQPEGEG